MNVRILFCLGLFLSSMFTGCQNTTESKNALDLDIRLSPDSSSIWIKNLPAELLSEMQNNSGDTILWKQLMAVYAEPADADLRDFQQALPGTYRLNNQQAEFTPRQPFKKGQAYFVLVYPRNLQLNLLSLLQKNSRQNQEKPLEYKFRY